MSVGIDAEPALAPLPPLREREVRLSLAQRLSSKAVAPWVFLSPVLAFGVVFFLLPIGFAAYVSLTRWNSLTPPRWVGLKNYEYLLTIDTRFWDTVANTITTTMM